MIDYKQEAEKLCADFVAWDKQPENVANVESFLSSFAERVRNDAIEDLIRKFEGRAKQYQAIGTSAADGLACQQLDIADAIRPSLRSLKQKDQWNRQINV